MYSHPPSQKNDIYSGLGDHSSNIADPRSVRGQSDSQRKQQDGEERGVSECLEKKSHADSVLDTKEQHSRGSELSMSQRSSSSVPEQPLGSTKGRCGQC